MLNRVYATILTLSVGTAVKEGFVGENISETLRYRKCRTIRGISLF
jgi:hypothetical protein